MQAQYLADHSADCKKCGTEPCVVVIDPETNRPQETELCGTCFFSDRLMVDPSEWNEQQEATE